MGIFDKAAKLFRYSDQAGFPQQTTSMASPFASGSQLAPVIAHDLGLTSDSPATALDAYKVPAISRGMALLTSTVASFELVADEGSTPAWLNETEGALTPAVRMASLVADLVLYRDAVWWVQKDQAQNINGALHLPRDLWSLDPYGRVMIGGQVSPDQSQFVYFQSLRQVGLLEAAADTIEQYLDISRTIRSRGRNPVPLIELHITEDFAGTTDELTQAQRDWSKARRAEDGAVAFTPTGIDLKTHTGNANDSEMLIGARNAVRLDVANFLNINAAMLDGNSGTSDTYSNTLQNKNEFLTLTLNEWLTPIAQRLSQPDVCGQVIRFDTSGFDADTPAKGNVGTAVETNNEEDTTHVES